MRLIPLLAALVMSGSGIFIADYNMGHVPFIFIFVSVGFGVAMYFVAAATEIAFNLKKKDKNHE